MQCRTTSLAVAVSALAVISAACEIRVRDSAFRAARDVHRLCVIASADDKQADALQHRLEAWLDAKGGALNLEVVRLDADDPNTNWRQSVGIPSAPPALPVTVLVGRNNGVGESFLIDYWETEPNAESLDAIGTSPVRTELARQLAEHVAVLLYAPADPDSQSSSLEEVRVTVNADLEGERIGLALMTIDRNDPKERLLCHFMGLRPGDPDMLCVAFGRGKIMGPPLVGEEINAENIDQLVTEIRQACSCSKPLPTLGVDLPLVWSDEIDSRVVLMDQELDLSNLEAEVQSLLAAKAASEIGGQPKTVPIPLGSQSPASMPKPSTELDSQGSRSLALVLVAGVAVLLSVSYWRSMRSRPLTGGH